MIARMLVILLTVAATATEVKLDSGTIRGETLDAAAGLRVYRGVPFAAPPVGANRWRPPQPVAAWEGVRDCTQFGHSCPQPGSLLGPAPTDQDEDCLYLNVWTAAVADEARPVMVWIHGGGHTIGSGHQRHYDGSQFARDGVVLVTINYRLGPLGWLAHEWLRDESPHGAAGNYGMLDQIAALQWVQRNIAAFGGDPGNVTIFGESAGSVSVGCLMTCPLAAGLFHRAIMESGVPSGVTQDLAAGMEQGRVLAEKLGAQGLAALRAVAPADLLAAADAKVGLLGKGVQWGPIADGYSLPESPMARLKAGTFTKVPLIIGTNADEGTLFLPQVDLRSALGYRWVVRRLFGADSARVLELFPPSREDPEAALARLVTVSSFVQPTRCWARWAAAGGSPVWLYHFTRVPELPGTNRVGATHAIEIPYVFRTGFIARTGGTDRALADAIAARWCRFAAAGNPNAKGLTPAWPPYTVATDQHLVFGDTLAVDSGLHREACDLFEPVMLKRLGLE